MPSELCELGHKRNKTHRIPITDSLPYGVNQIFRRSNRSNQEQKFKRIIIATQTITSKLNKNSTNSRSPLIPKAEGDNLGFDPSLKYRELATER